MSKEKYKAITLLLNATPAVDVEESNNVLFETLFNQNYYHYYQPMGGDVETLANNFVNAYAYLFIYEEKVYTNNPLAVIRADSPAKVMGGIWKNGAVFIDIDDKDRHVYLSISKATALSMRAPHPRDLVKNEE